MRGRQDLGSKTLWHLQRIISSRRGSYEYSELPPSSLAPTELSPIETDSPSNEQQASSPVVTRTSTAKLPFRRMFTRNLRYTLVAYVLMLSLTGTFQTLWATFLPTPVYDPAHPPSPNYQPDLPFRFTGGLGLPTSDIGLAMATMGVLGICIQIFLFPIVTHHIGILRSYKLALYLFPLNYTLVPFLSLLPSTTPAPAKKSGPLIWLAICACLLLQVLARAFAIPASNLLVNNACPHPSVLGTTHGLAMSLSSGARTILPILTGWLYGVGLQRGFVVVAWWFLASLALLNIVMSWFVREGSGHEIILEGDVLEDDEDGQRPAQR